MHLLFDQRLTDPTAARVAAALKRFCAIVNGKRKTGVLKLTENSRKLLGRRVCQEPQGLYAPKGTYSATDTSHIVLAWWTAPGGRKLVRIRGWRARWEGNSGIPDDPRVQARHEYATRHPGWHLDPERMTIVETDGRPECIAVCGCGAVGSPESLGWAGAMCGPCRDRVEELGSDAVTHEPGLLNDEAFTPHRVRFRPDGKQIVAVGGNAYRMWDWPSGELVESGQGTGTRTVPTISPDCRDVLLTEADGNVVLARRRSGPKGEPVRLPYSAVAGVASFNWTGRPGEFLVQSIYPDSPLRLFAVDEDGAVRESTNLPPIPSAHLNLVHADGPRAVFTDNGNVVVSQVGLRGELTTLHEFRLGTGQYDRTRNWTGNPKLVRFTADGERLLFVAHRDVPVYGSDLADTEHVELWNPARPKALLQATFPTRIADAKFSPDGDHLFVLGENGTIFICHPGLLTHVRARLRWHIGRVTSLAVSPDGKVLATAGAEGVKLWPVARLLEVL